MIVASLRNFPRFAVAQRDGRWDHALSEPVAGKRVLIVGYGDIGAAVERRLAGWDVTVERVARRARDGVHAIDELPRTAAGRRRRRHPRPGHRGDEAAGRHGLPRGP